MHIRGFCFRCVLWFYLKLWGVHFLMNQSFSSMMFDNQHLYIHAKGFRKNMMAYEEVWVGLGCFLNRLVCSIHALNPENQKQWRMRYSRVLMWWWNACLAHGDLSIPSTPMPLFPNSQMPRMPQMLQCPKCPSALTSSVSLFQHLPHIATTSAKNGNNSCQFCLQCATSTSKVTWILWGNGLFLSCDWSARCKIRGTI